uniref:hypothetical protein n=1 Tax=Clostridium sp. NkU-1 TaxID=1095009 RepID=UPI0006CF4AC5
MKESCQQFRVKMSVGAAGKIIKNPSGRPCFPVWPGGIESVIYIRNGQDTGIKGNILACKAEGISASVIFFVMGLDPL